MAGILVAGIIFGVGALVKKVKDRKDAKEDAVEIPLPLLETAEILREKSREHQLSRDQLFATTSGVDWQLDKVRTEKMRREGLVEAKLMRECNEGAAAMYFSHHNPDGYNSDEINLQGLSVKEAITYMNVAIKQALQNNINLDNKKKYLTFVVGRETPSGSGMRKLKHDIEIFLLREYCNHKSKFNKKKFKKNSLYFELHVSHNMACEF
mmetsp:Transcript_31351/g.29895  ORF Transcript_31351/g.29895 Transcript_31351/m.29895 type:complete len:209 (+) Transcript_31351:275-901(+)